ncbi:MAG TPA: NAD(P)/FAD-dependent oxidoreductase [Solirubrobacteraceae bacterium]|jgi:NADH dehydrogenase|nr:NAD(P)/FAD-dependent oxidoreductase [Solirubrobacteraceae bacterium]
MEGEHRRKVVIVGGGFGGLAAAHELRHADVDVTLVDRTHHHLFQPLLYQVAGGGLAAGECASPIRTALRRNSNITVLMGEATGLDVESRQLVLDRGERLDYDSLIVACGAETSYFGKDEWREVSCGLKTLADALDLRNRLYGAFEEAERASDPSEQRQWMTFVVIGGGPTGVELAGELRIIAQHGMKRGFRRIDPRNAQVILLDAGERVTAAFSKRLSGKVAKELASLGVTVREGARVTAIDAQGVTASVAGADERIDARTVIWAAGVQAVGFAGVLAQATGASADRAGRVQVQPDLTIAGYPEISMIGDASTLTGPGGKPFPGLATVAIQQARHAAKAIAGGAPGASTPFHYFDKGALAVVGRGKAVCEIRGHEISGRLAFFTYLTVHMYYLGGVRGGRIKVLIDWISARLGNPQNQVMDGYLSSVERLPPGADPSGGDRISATGSGER